MVTRQCICITAKPRKERCIDSTKPHPDVAHIKYLIAITVELEWILLRQLIQSCGSRVPI